MKIGYNWLRDFVDFEMSPEELARCLTMLGFPVEWMGPCEPAYPGIFVGEVLEVKKHPRADRLVLCEVAVGSKNLHIVCGATNVRPGMKVPVACVGSVLPGDKKIERVTIRGETSEGMLCSGAELCLSSDSAGIMDLSGEGRSGATLDEQLGIEEVVLELEVGHNRPDCLSVFGIAREVAAFNGSRLKVPKFDRTEESPKPDETVGVRIEEGEDCPRYCGLVVSGVSISGSPAWLKKRLGIAGFRALNNVVDSTNYCLASFGQPIHAFDLDRMGRKSILVRRGKPMERMLTLDGVARLLGPEVLLITDGETPIAVAGIMGGKDTEVTETSTRLFLESANFSRSAVKSGSKKLGLETEASVRFSRGTDPEMARWCVEYVGWLISSLSGGVYKGKTVDNYVLRRPPAQVSVNPQRMGRVLGSCVPVSFMKERMSALGFGWEPEGENVKVSVPSYRHDVVEEVDVVEEIARSYGYDKFPERAANMSWVPGEDEEGEIFLDRVADCLAGLGMNEVISKVLVDPEKASRFVANEAPERLVKLSNPASSSEAVMRPSVLCSLLEIVGTNLRRGAEDLRLFEVGKVFFNAGPGLPEERYFVAGALCGRRRPPSWREAEPQNCDMYEAKGIVERVLDKLKVDNYDTLCYDGFTVAKEESAAILCNGKRLGILGLASRELLRSYDIERDVYVFELDAELLKAAALDVNRFEEPSRFPPVKRDIAVIVDDAQGHDEVVGLIKNLAGESLHGIELFDVYTGEAVSKGKKSLAFSMIFQSRERTLSDVEVDETMKRILDGLEASGAGVRGR